MIKLVVAGSKGRMGQLILEMAKRDNRFSSVLGFDKDDDSSIIARGDVLIDFTVPVATLEHLKLVQSLKKAFIIGTTGLDSAMMSAIGQAALSIPIVRASNMSRGMNVMFKEAQNIAKYLKPKKIRIVEKHHIHKKDSPSGSALSLKEFVLAPESAWTGDIPIQSIREGEIVGEHSVILEGWEEEIEIIHRAKSRAPFSVGALDAAVWAVEQRPGLFSMQDVLKLSQKMDPRFRGDDK
jgi:4-hydroxy-tetrahydrodipicolinate reductase